MARTVDYVKKIEKIKVQLDELSNVIDYNQTGDKSNESTPVVRKMKISDIDLEQEDIKTLLKVQSKISNIISKKLKDQ